MLGTNFDLGILNHTMKDIYSFVAKHEDTREITLWATYMEIYNEQVNDLLDQNNINLKIREDPVEGYYASGLKMVKLTNLDDFKKLLSLGEKARKYRVTDLNEHSSRSHSIFRITVENRLSESRRIVVEK